MRIERLQREHGVRVKWTHFPLHPDTPPEGRSLEELFAGRGYDLKAMKARMSSLMADEGLPYGDRSMTYNSRLAQELGKWADTQPGGETIHRALFHAYFVDTVNIADANELVRIAESCGLDGKAAREVVESRSFSAAIDADWRRSGEFGITGVPTFVAGGYGLVGAQPYDALEKLVKLAKEQPREEALGGPRD